jgi:hypothetical protein
LESAFSEGHEFATGGNQTGKHTTPTFKDNGGDPSQPTGTNELTLYNSGGLAYFLNQSGTKRDVGPIPSGTKMLFKQSSAPAGWTFKAEDNDRALINTSTEADGGATGGTWQLPNVNGTNLSTAQLPNISGYFDIRRADTGKDWVINTSGVFSKSNGANAEHQGGGTGQSTNTDRVSFNVGNGDSHTHSQTNTWRPSYAKVITCEKV